MIRYNIFIYSLRQYTHSKVYRLIYTYYLQPKHFIAGSLIVIFFSENTFGVKKTRVTDPFKCSLNIMSLFGTNVVGNFY